ncbi:MAG: hypothetical protein EOM54_00110 [Clostridia bacterium]|nr:hypothetical protein [Clostridia bacterium]
MKKTILIVIGIAVLITCTIVLINREETLADLTFSGKGEYFSISPINVKVTDKGLYINCDNILTYIGNKEEVVTKIEYSVEFWEEGENTPLKASSGNEIFFNERLEPQDNITRLNIISKQSGPIYVLSWIDRVKGERIPREVYELYAQHYKVSKCTIVLDMFLEDGEVLTDHIEMTTTDNIQKPN